MRCARTETDSLLRAWVLPLDLPLHEEGMPVERDRAAACTMSINEGSDHRGSCWPSRPEIHFLVSRAYQVSQHFCPRSAQPFLVMTDGAFVALVFVLSNLVDWLVSLISLLAYLPPAFTQNSGWRRCW